MRQQNQSAPNSSSVSLTVDDGLIRWLVVDSQGMLPLTLKRSPTEEEAADEEFNGDVCDLSVDVGDPEHFQVRRHRHLLALGAPHERCSPVALEGSWATPRLTHSERSACSVSCSVDASVGRSKQGAEV